MASMSSATRTGDSNSLAKIEIKTEKSDDDVVSAWTVISSYYFIFSFIKIWFCYYLLEIIRIEIAKALGYNWIINELCC